MNGARGVQGFLIPTDLIAINPTSGDRSNNQQSIKTDYPFMNKAVSDNRFFFNTFIKYTNEIVDLRLRAP